MATATKPKSKTATNKTAGPKPKEFPVTYGGMSGRDKIVRIGVRINRGAIQLETADELFCARRLDVRIMARGDSSQQRLMWEDAAHRLSATCDVKRFGVSSETVSVSLAFVMNDVKAEELLAFTGKEGILQVFAVNDADPSDDDDDAEDEDEEEETETAAEE